MSLEVLRAEFDAHKAECSRDRLLLAAGIDKLLASMEGKVSFKHFYWIVGTLVGIQTAIFGGAFWLLNAQMNALNMQTSEIGKITSAVQGDVSFLKGKLSPFEVKYEK